MISGIISCLQHSTPRVFLKDCEHKFVVASKVSSAGYVPASLQQPCKYHSEKRPLLRAEEFGKGMIKG